MKTILETERLRLREFTLDDTAFIIELLNSPGWLQYIGNRNIDTEEKAKEYLQNVPLKSYAQNGFGLWLVETKEDAKPAGMCGLIKREHLDTEDIGFAFLPEFHGRGYAQEIAQATVAFAKNNLNIPVLSAIVMAENKASIKLIEKLGLSFVKTFSFPDSNEELLLYKN